MCIASSFKKGVPKNSNALTLSSDELTSVNLSSNKMLLLKYWARNDCTTFKNHFLISTVQPKNGRALHAYKIKNFSLKINNKILQF